MDDDNPLASVDVDLSTQSLLLASANHDLDAVITLLKTTAASVQDSDTGYSPLHAAIAACEQDGVNGLDVNEDTEREAELAQAADTVRLLLQSGAIWNVLDANDETPGCIARRLSLNELYRLVVDAGVRSELLLSKLDEYELLGDDDDEVQSSPGSFDPRATSQELDSEQPGATLDPSASNALYLQDHISFSEGSILDSATNGVMMSWEKPIMERHAALLLPRSGLRVLNVGHGMGIIDEFFQSNSPSSHHIIEAHPEILAKMKEQGWSKKTGVVVHEGKWQDVLPELVAGGGDASEVLFDAIYFDTFAEDYKALREFFSEWAVQLLDAEGHMAFFNGMGADRQVCHDVYNQVVEIDLFEAGFNVEWQEIPVADLNATAEWNGVRRPYWNLKTYKLPTCKLVT